MYVVVLDERIVVYVMVLDGGMDDRLSVSVVIMDEVMIVYVPVMYERILVYNAI